MSCDPKRSLEYSSWLEQQQLLDPANLVLAHDLGLAHYWRAKKQGLGEEAVEHWQRVIANWVRVLESDAYWQDWCAERGQIYGKSITEDHISGVRQKLRETLAGELADVAQVDSSEIDLHLEAAFHLEVKATRLLKQMSEATSSSATDSQLHCGPLLAWELSMQHQVEDFFRRWSTAQDHSDSLQAILAFVQKDGHLTGASGYTFMQQLRLCFSQLGTPLIYLEREEPQRALRLLTGLRCSACESERDHQAYLPFTADQLPVRCHDECADFARLNPAYAVVSGGRDLFYRHAIEMNIGARLSLAHQLLVARHADVSALLEYLRETLDIGQIIRVHEPLKAAIANLMLGWADALGQDERWDEAVTLLEGAEPFDAEERWKGKLAGLLNARGVQNANDEHWGESVTYLRQALALNPYNRQVRRNLEIALHRYATAMHEAGDDELARSLLTEATQLGEELPSPVAPLHEEELLPVVASDSALTLALEERANPDLFDEQGLLKMDVFDESGQAVLAQAREEGATMGETLLSVPALLLAMVRFEDGETKHLLELQGISPQQLQVQVEAAAPDAVPNERLRHIAAVSQFDLRFSVLKILDLAWEIAQYDRGWISELHILYGLLVSGHGAKWLEGAGVDADQMVEQAAWC